MTTLPSKPQNHLTRGCVKTPYTLKRSPGFTPCFSCVLGTGEAAETAQDVLLASQEVGCSIKLYSNSKCWHALLVTAGSNSQPS